VIEISKIIKNWRYFINKPINGIIILIILGEFMTMTKKSKSTEIEIVDFSKEYHLLESPNGKNFSLVDWEKRKKAMKEWKEEIDAKSPAKKFHQ
jgi:hypothetical protein